LGVFREIMLESLTLRVGLGLRSTFSDAVVLVFLGSKYWPNPELKGVGSRAREKGELVAAEQVRLVC
jgi:hypothetical protein